jgi:pimeloyl-ACP methyl ester carboxylesterase
VVQVCTNKKEAHLPSMEQPGEFNRIVLGFLQTVV